MWSEHGIPEPCMVVTDNSLPKKVPPSRRLAHLGSHMFSVLHACTAHWGITSKQNYADTPKQGGRGVDSEAEQREGRGGHVLYILTRQVCIFRQTKDKGLSSASCIFPCSIHVRDMYGQRERECKGVWGGGGHEYRTVMGTARWLHPSSMYHHSAWRQHVIPLRVLLTEFKTAYGGHQRHIVARMFAPPVIMSEVSGRTRETNQMQQLICACNNIIITKGPFAWAN